ncbi:flp operon protein C [Aggregatibacter actinomycetemcomitans]|uniref:SAF domain-containing protein n=1 Tax=Aggregatibacter actinomycetemcomitans TaxID=714 RepID=UPI00197C616E|nr:SAF domain-containing protein [Aggregatibacter actinomycetemcomitans]MBN6075270.1 flp operon protein C [Aggregatibacter actinomycetemcomitans]
MNYRTLLIISVLTLAVGIGGIMFMPTESENTENQQTNTNQAQPEPQAEKKPEQLILIAELKKDISKGQLLQADDYALSEVSVTEDSPLIGNDLKAIVATNGIQGLQGYLMAENVKAGSLLSSKTIIGPSDPRFFTSSLDPNQEVAYRIYLKPGDDYILNTIHGGDYVVIYNQQIANDSRNTYDRRELVKISGKTLVLQSKSFVEEAANKPDDEKSSDGIPKNQEYAGYIALKVTGEQAKKFYSLDQGSKLVVLPAEDNDQDIDSRGVFIRKLRGQ